MQQFVHVVGEFPSLLLPLLLPPVVPASARFVFEPFLDEGGGDEGRLGATDDSPDIVPVRSAGGELGLDWAMRSKGFPLPAMLAAGVEVVLGIFCRQSGPKDCDWERPRAPTSHSPAEST